MTIGYLQSLQRYLLLQLCDPFPDERGADIQRQLRLVARAIAHLAG